LRVFPLSLNYPPQINAAGRVARGAQELKQCSSKLGEPLLRRAAIESRWIFPAIRPRGIIPVAELHSGL